MSSETKARWHRVHWDDERGVADEIPSAGPVLVTTRTKKSRPMLRS